jgi:hypothetical protein
LTSLLRRLFGKIVTLREGEAATALLMFGLQVAFVHPDAVHGVLTEVVCPA